MAAAIHSKRICSILKHPDSNRLWAQHDSTARFPATTAAHSTGEAECMSISECGKETVHIKGLFEEQTNKKL